MGYEMKNLILSRFKLISIGAGITIILAAVYLFNWQGNKLDAARNEVSELRQVISLQQQTVSTYKRELEIQREINVRVTTELSESDKRKNLLQKDIGEIRRSNDEVDEYLSTTIPDNLYNRLR